MIVSLIVALAGLLSAVAGIAGLFIKIRQVHVLVNSQLSRMVTRVEQLAGGARGAGIDVPARLINGGPAPPAPPA